MIGASSGLRLRASQPELSAAKNTMPDAANKRPTSSSAQCNTLPPRSDNAGQCSQTDASARISQMKYGSASTIMTRSANNGSKDIATRRPREVASAKPITNANRPIPAEVVSNSSPASMDQANHTL